jgi:hypothetical protein
LAREKAREILDEDESLSQDKNRILKETILAVLQGKPNWGRIS